MTVSKHERTVETGRDEVEQWLDDLDPAATTAYDAAPHRRILSARHTLSDAEGGLRQAVTDARAAGYSWAMIGASLGVSRQAAQQRFGEAPAAGRSSDGERRPA